MKKTFGALTLLLVLPFSAQAAEQLSYNHVTLGYAHAHSGDLKARGWGLNGSIALSPNFSVYAGTEQMTVRNANGLNANQWRLGVGYNHEISQNTDFIARIGYQRAVSGDHAGFAALRTRNNVHFNGYNLEGGVRSALGERFEGQAVLSYENYRHNHGFSPKGQAYLGLGGQFKFNPNWGINADVKLASGDRSFSIGPRLSW